MVSAAADPNPGFAQSYVDQKLKEQGDKHAKKLQEHEDKFSKEVSELMEDLRKRRGQADRQIAALAERSSRILSWVRFDPK
eukprot:SAG22_NODE_10162_length_549_cov_5.355556_1_plen_81_part_00